ncbi:MAG: hypothetical protein JWR51_4652 [Devosia sp.]|uniref:hypothetical protein n=1 Tax=Devosia sp. TaxID=1871048 RepID=UPI0026289588|nr:hypothetical protein [Devosia sp.]MDB5531549.1 hypothetical protein [Devosia sp.]
MNFHWPFRRPKPAHTAVRYVVPTRHEQTEAQRREANRRASINAQLAVYSAVTTAEQRRTETEAYIARKRAEREMGK